MSGINKDKCLYQAASKKNYDRGLKLDEAFGWVLRELRGERALPHERLAELAGLHPPFISLLERGGRMPSLNTVFLLAEALRVSPSEIVRRVERLKARPLR